MPVVRLLGFLLSLAPVRLLRCVAPWQERRQPVEQVRFVAEALQSAPGARSPHGRVVEHQAAFDETKPGPGGDAVVERDRQDRIDEVVPQANGENHQIGILA
jgi:hypothetical protein